MARTKVVCRIPGVVVPLVIALAVGCGGSGSDGPAPTPAPPQQDVTSAAAVPTQEPAAAAPDPELIVSTVADAVGMQCQTGIVETATGTVQAYCNGDAGNIDFRFPPDWTAEAELRAADCAANDAAGGLYPIATDGATWWLVAYDPQGISDALTEDAVTALQGAGFTAQVALHCDLF